MCVYYMEGEPLSDVEPHPYLGVELDSSLSWDLHLAKDPATRNDIVDDIVDDGF